MHKTVKSRLSKPTNDRQKNGK